jgi:hypothetical protein
MGIWGQPVLTQRRKGAKAQRNAGWVTSRVVFASFAALREDPGIVGQSPTYG